ncbi:hypothetical protein NE237_000632 [Protea cynaroides]|uniref:DUF7906 domain-containing protein n=1 Tax=Protea cynaroides TaxID=273540 RepID=A0A9Q0KSG3_9MAGN|nr:hypothetical protein NE237_000632 [Protea cynaroides]
MLLAPPTTLIPSPSNIPSISMLLPPPPPSLPRSPEQFALRSNSPCFVVDRIVKQDFEKEKPVEEVYINLLSLNPQFKRYAYSYAFGDSSPAFTRCLGSIWTGKDRYLWIDLAAGPVNYGLTLSGDGLLLGGEFHPLAALHGPPKSQKALLADLASLRSEGNYLHGLDWKSIERTFMDEEILSLVTTIHSWPVQSSTFWFSSKERNPLKRLPLVCQPSTCGNLKKKRKALQALKTEERKVDVDKEFGSVQQLSNKKKANDDVFIKLDKQKEIAKEKLKRMFSWILQD